MTPAHLRVVLLGSRHGGAGWARGQFHRPLGRRISVGRGDRVSGRGRAKGKTEGKRKEVGGRAVVVITHAVTPFFPPSRSLSPFPGLSHPSHAEVVNMLGYLFFMPSYSTDRTGPVFYDGEGVWGNKGCVAW